MQRLCGFLIALCSSLALAGGWQSPTARAQPATEIGDRLELFIDHHLIKSLDGVELKLHPPVEREIAIRADSPWEGSGNAYFTVFADDHLFRMYYRGSPNEGGPETTCYAVSTDGIHWTKPKLGLFAFKGSRENNIIWMGKPHLSAHNFTPFKDPRPEVPASERYKALAGTPLYAFRSADGVRWHLLQNAPVITKGRFDSQNLAFWDPNKNRYVSYFRVTHQKRRFVALVESDDFLNWSEPQLIDVGDTPPEHFYTNATLPYFRAPHIYFSFPKRFVPLRKLAPEYPETGISEAVFLSSRDGIHFDRTFLEALIRPGRDPRNWGDRGQMPAWGLVQTGPDEMSLYYSRNYNFPTVHERRGVFRLDGIASAHAGYKGGELVTKLIKFKGNQLVLNFATAASGSVQVELQDAEGTSLPGLSMNDAPELFGDEIAKAYAWSSKATLGDVAGRPVRLRIRLKDADVFSYRFTP